MKDTENTPLLIGNGGSSNKSESEAVGLPRQNIIEHSGTLEVKTRSTYTDYRSTSSHNVCNCGTVPLLCINIVLALLTLLTQIFKSVSLPAYTEAVTSSGSDPFSVVLIAAFWFQWFFLLVSIIYKVFIDSDMNLLPTTKWRYIILIGFLNGAAGIPTVFASDPSRTPPYLQAVLSTLLIPFTVMFRYLILKKEVGIKRSLCTIAVIVGFVISLIPQVTGLEQHPAGKCSLDVEFNGTDYPPVINWNETDILSSRTPPMVPCVPGDVPAPFWYRLMWPIIFGLGFLPISLMLVLAEMELKREDVRSFTFLLWLHITTFLTLVALFWTDLIPEIGMADSIEEFGDKLLTGLTCHFSLEPECQYVILTSWMYILGNCLNILFQFLLTKHAEGSIYTTIVSAVGTPLIALFWTMFTLEPFFVWSPAFNVTTIYILAGLMVMVPGVVLYNIISIREERKQTTTVLQDSKASYEPL